MILPQAQAAHHTTNAAAVTIPLAAFWLNAPQYLTVLTAALGCVWYCILIGERVAAIIRRWKGQKQETKE